MRRSQIIPHPRIMSRPCCEVCDSEMWLVAIEPDDAPDHMLDRALNRIIAREQEVRALIETAPNGIVVVDDQGLIRMVNATAESSSATRDLS